TAARERPPEPPRALPTPESRRLPPLLPGPLPAPAPASSSRTRPCFVGYQRSYAIWSSHISLVAHIQKQPVLDHAGNVKKCARQRFWLRNAAKKSIKDEVSTISDEGLAGGRTAQLQLPLGAVGGEHCRDGPLRGAQAETVDFNWERIAAEGIDELAGIGDHDHLVGGRRDDLLAQQGTAAALDEVHVGVDLVGAIHGEVEAIEGIEVGKGNAERTRLPVGGLGSGNAQHFEPIANALAQQVDEVPGGGAGAEAEAHTWAHVVQRHRGSFTLPVFAHATPLRTGGA